MFAFSADASAGVVVTHEALTPARGDGQATIAWIEQPGTIRVHDMGSRSTADIDVSSGCATPPQLLIAVGGGEILYGCDYDFPTTYGVAHQSEPHMLDIAGRAVRAPIGAREVIESYATSNFGSVNFTDVGTEGIRALGGSYHAEYQPFSLNWHTGVTIPGDGTETSVPDLDSPTLLRTLCEPLRQSPVERDDDFFGGPKFEPLLYEAPYGVHSGPRTGLSIQRCGSERSQILRPWHQRRPNPVEVQLAAGYVSWFIDGALQRELHAYLPMCRLRLMWRTSTLAHVAHVDGAVILSEASRGNGRWTVRALPLSGACSRMRAASSARVSSGGRAVRPALVSASLADKPSGAVASPLTAGRAPIARLPLRDGARVRLSLRVVAHTVQWRLGSGAWQMAVGGGRTWSLLAPRSQALRELRLSVRTADGGHRTFAVRVPARKGG